MLNFSNDALATSPQTHLVPVSGMFTFTVPTATYSKFFLFFNGAAGGTAIKVTLTYSDAMDTQNATIPDYYSDPTDPTVFNLAPNLAKWDMKTAINEADHHNINGVALTTMPTKMLTSVKVERGAQVRASARPARPRALPAASRSRQSRPATRAAVVE